METWPMTEARRQLPALLDKVRDGRWQLIGRRGRPEAVIADAAQMAELLRACYPFSPEVFVEQDEVGIYLTELEVHGTGATLQDAEDDLLEAALDYVEDWEDHLKAAPNHRGNVGYVRRLELAGDAAGVRSVLFGEPPAQAPSA
jgi:prevent-host-death family protein